KYRKEIITFMVLLLFLINTTGCGLFGNKNTATAKVEKKLELAVKYLAGNKFKEAVLAYKEVITIDSKNVTAYKGLSLVYVMQKKPGEAEKALQEGLKATSNHEQLQLVLAGLLVDQGNNDQAEDIYKELISKENPSLAAYRAYSYYLSQADKSKEAIALLEQGSAKQPQIYQLYSMLAELYIQDGNNKKALAFINKSLDVEPDQSAIYKNLSEIYKDQGDQLVALGVQYTQQRQIMAGLLYKLYGLSQMKQYAELVKTYENASADLKKHSCLTLLAAQAYRQMDQSEKAEALMKTVNTTDIKDAGMLADLADYYLQSGDRDTARKMALQGISADAAIIENYAVIYESYDGEDETLLKIWALKYLLNSSLSFKTNAYALMEYGVALNLLLPPGDVSRSKDIVVEMIKDSKTARSVLKSQPDALEVDGAEYYLDTKNNVAYRGYCEKSTNWQPVIERYHSPVIYNKDNIPPHIMANINRLSGGWKQFISENRGCTKYILVTKSLRTDRSYADTSLDYPYPVALEGDIPLEEHMKRIGYPIDNVIFRDINQKPKE
ncbi:MAG: tetratricopeptide repeat protein, partial [Ignavibacteriales bacterium]